MPHLSRLLRQSLPVLLLCFAACPVLQADSAKAKSTPQVHGTKVNGVYEGPVEIWTTPDVKEAAGAFHHGHPDGPWTFWDKDGTKIAEITYRSGTFSGSVTLWRGSSAGPDVSGTLKLRGSFNDGDWSGSVLTYYPDGKDRCERVYTKGVVTSAYAYGPRGNPLTPKQAMKVAAEDEPLDNAFVDALDAFVTKWVK
jgi:hypothetical protein